MEHRQLIEEDQPFWTRTRRHKLALALVVLLVLVLLAVVPPLVSINSYQKRVAAAISGSLGRPVHFDNLTLHLLPLPGITIENFVVGESHDFGAEPVMRAQNVEARLRFGSLWRRRIEVSRIVLDSPSINLVRRRADGAWNLQSILTQASQMNSAPTAQASAGEAPRFPYIEATDARINIKSDDDKLPFSFKETDLALWLPEPNEWHLRLKGKPVRTDTDVSDVGLVSVEATLGRATDLASAPIELTASWKPTQLGEAGKLTAGHDLGWRGTASAAATLKGTLGKSKLTADLHLLGLRRADFVPEHTAEINAHCEATTGGLLRSLQDLRCAIPTNSDTSMFAVIDNLRTLPQTTSDSDALEDAVKPGVLLVRGDVPDLLNLSHAELAISLQGASPNYALAWLRLFSKRIPPDKSVGGTFSLAASTSPLHQSGGSWNIAAECICDLDGDPLAKEHSDAAKLTHWIIDLRRGTEDKADANGVALSMVPAPASAVEVKPVLDATHAVYGAGAAIPADAVTGQVTRNGYALTYGSRPMASFVASVLPPLGDGLPAADDTTGLPQAQRTWNGAQSWTMPSAAPHATTRRHHAK